MTDEIPPTCTSLSMQISVLEHHSKTILFLSAINMFMNIATIAIGFLIAM